MIKLLELSDKQIIRVYDAGHMVPMDQPQPALQLVNQFITNTLTP